MPSEPESVYDVALRVARALECVGVPYFLGGSLASSVQGEPRATNDIDFVVELTPAQIAPLAAELGPDFEIDEEALADAVRRQSSWNIYFLPLVMKIDLFQRGVSPFDASEFSRRRPFELGNGRTLYIKSPEDSVLRKLLWFRAGGEQLSQQWRDVVEVLRVSAAELDGTYMDEWATRLGLAELLTRARAEADKASG